MTADAHEGAQPRAVRLLALVLFLLSGACGLAYEIVWVRQLTLVAGATTPAVSTVLAVFMGGLALGARGFGRYVDRSSNPLRLYALLELGIGLYALIQPTLLEVAAQGYVTLARSVGLEGFGLIGARLAMAAAVLLVPCILMGGTLPVLARFFGRGQERFGLDLGTLYAINLVGAVVGSLLTGFVLLRLFGVLGTIITAAAGNVLIALVAWGAATRLALSTTTAGTDSSVPEQLPTMLGRLLWGLAAFSGFATMGYQVTWARMLSFGFDNTVYAFTIILVTFLLGLSFGSLIFAALDRRVQRMRLLLAANVFGGITALLLAPLAALQPQLLDSLTERFGLTGTAQLGAMVLGAVAVMLVPATLMGIVFPLVGRSLVGRQEEVGRQLGRAYWVNTLGAIAGSLLTGFLLLPLLSLKGCLLALAGAQVAAGLCLLPWCAVGRSVQLGFGAAAAAASIMSVAIFESLLPGQSPFDQIIVGNRRAAALRAHHDDVTASVSVVEAEDGSRALRINGFEMAADDTGASYMPMMGHLPLLIHPNPKKVLVICFGTGSTAGAALYYDDIRVDTVDINETVFEFAPWFERTNHSVFKDPRATMIVDDGRNFLLTTRETYDVITAEPMPPIHAGVVNLYSREYYELARSRLAPGGLLVQWLPFHLLQKDEAFDVLRTVQLVFPETSLWMHFLTGLIVARKEEPVQLTAQRLVQVWSEPARAKELARLGVPSPEDLTQLYLLGRRGVASLVRGGPIITDDHPSLEFHPLRHHYLQRVGPYTQAGAEVLAAAFHLREQETFPLEGAAPASQKAIQSVFHVQNIILEGDLQMDIDRPDEARRIYERGLVLGPATRPIFLSAMALAEQAQGNVAEARRLLEEALAANPSYERAREMLRGLDSAAPRS
jgi:spermidine synthase